MAANGLKYRAMINPSTVSRFAKPALSRMIQSRCFCLLETAGLFDDSVRIREHILRLTSRQTIIVFIAVPVDFSSEMNESLCKHRAAADFSSGFLILLPSASLRRKILIIFTLVRGNNVSLSKIIHPVAKIKMQRQSRESPFYL